MPSPNAEAFLAALVAALKEERSKQKLSQEKWAVASGVDRAAISRLERLERIPSILALFDLADALGKPLAYFVTEAQKVAPAKKPKAGH